MQIVKTIHQVRDVVKMAKLQGKSVGLVPTMGALHAGHVSLIKEATRQCDFVVVSIFVNPTQFGPGEDLDKYPKPFENDCEICRSEKTAVIFAPEADEMYSEENLTWVNVDKLTGRLCGKDRPGHFKGVTTVCAKLFNIVGADKAFFGQKDAQQSIVIKRMVSDLNMPVEIMVCPTVREADGLAMSSRNRYLDAGQRKDALCLYNALKKCEQMVASGIIDTKAIINEMEAIISGVSYAQIDYISIVDVGTLEAVERVEGEVLVALAVKIGPARLIDNVILRAQKGRV